MRTGDAWCVVCTANALKCALNHVAKECTGSGKSMDAPAMAGIGGSLLRFVEDCDNGRARFDRDFDWLAGRDPKPHSAGYTALIT